MSRRRRALALVGLAVLSMTAGCFGPGAIPQEQLDSEPDESYTWDADVDAHIVVQSDGQFRAVYRLSERETELFRRDGFGSRNPLDVSALRYRYPNGTVVNGTELEARGGSIQRSRSEVTVTLPSDAPADGRLAFTAGSTPKRFALPTFVKGSYEVVLPPNRRVDFPVFGSVSPPASRTEVVDGQTHIYWDEVTSDSITVQFYLQRDLTIFGVAVAVLVTVGLGGLLYYRRKIEAIRRQREELGLDVETDDDEFDRGPPPGMG